MPTTPMPLTIPPRPCTRFAKHCPDVVAVVIVRILVVPPRCAHPPHCRPATPPPPSCSERCSRRHHTMHSSSEASSTAMMSKRSKEGGWSSIGEIRSKKRWMCSVCAYVHFSCWHHLFFKRHYSKHEAEMAQKTTEMAIQTPVLMKLDPIWGYFCISDHSLILL